MCFLSPRILQPKFLIHSFFPVSRNMSLISPIVMPSLVRLLFLFLSLARERSPDAHSPVFRSLPTASIFIHKHYLNRGPNICVYEIKSCLDSFVPSLPSYSNILLSLLPFLFSPTNSTSHTIPMHAFNSPPPPPPPLPPPPHRRSQSPSQSAGQSPEPPPPRAPPHPSPRHSPSAWAAAAACGQ